MKARRLISILTTIAMSVFPGIASPSEPAEAPVSPPQVPSLSSVAGGNLPAHTDYVRITYAMEHGETAVSSEASLSVLDNNLTVVHSPRPIRGAIGYNVYAVANNGGSGNGETLQNVQPIPFGRNIIEPLSGWEAGRLPPVKGTAFQPLIIIPSGYSVLMPPPAPQLSAQVPLPARSDYVRVTYVNLHGGETTASAESVNSAIANTLTVVLSPPPVNGAIGYNVYAIQNNGGSGTGETLQNPRPIPLWTNYREPASGWIQGSHLPTRNTTLSPRVKAPNAPQLTSQQLPAIEAHTDYVKITYVSHDGETLAGPESAISLLANCLTIVKSPPAVKGVIGYNVYAVKNNGGSATGETLQNRKPIPIGTDYVEPVHGWRTDAFEPPISGTALVPTP